MQVEQVDFVSVPTRDVSRAVAWYRDVLGLHVYREYGASGRVTTHSARTEPVHSYKRQRDSESLRRALVQLQRESAGCPNAQDVSRVLWKMKMA